jgi:uncharacterized protein
MSQENVEIVRRLFEAFNRHDLQALAELSHQDVEFISVVTVEAEAATFRGPDTWASYFAAMDQTWADWRAEDFQVLDAGDDRVVCVFRITGSGKQSGVPVERAVGVAYRIRQRKVWRMRSYLNPAEALEAVGLRE